MADAESPKAVVLEFYKLALEQLRPKDAFEKYATPDFVEHSVDIEGGTRQAAITFLEGLIRRFPAPKWKIVRSAAEGDLAFLHVHVTPAPGERGVAIVEIFRVRDGKITEHWDVIQPVPEKPVNSNSMF
ncbi:MAG TPA: nuclear transport factor 2 family protein [Candidatus Binataceae bacterium]|jgi:predicted SnoaL-like aldol condensation-catalyzing enzyme